MLKKLIGLGVISTLLVACSKPLPTDKQNYSGTWQSEDGSVNLMITPEGRVEYSNKQPNSSSSVSAPISKFEGNNFSAGIGPLSTEFKSFSSTATNCQWDVEHDGRWTCS